jgi:hypothetical protein
VQKPPTGLAAIGYPAGCSSTRTELAWVALPILLVGALHRRRLKEDQP